jgi:hypothetical protein
MADRRPPERLSINGPDDAAGGSANRASDNQAGARAGSGANHVGVSARNGHTPCG